MLVNFLTSHHRRRIETETEENVHMNVYICIGSSCYLKGSRDIITILERLINIHNVKDKVTLMGSFCMGRCVDGVCCKIDDQIYSLTPAKTEEFFVKEILGRLNK